MKGGRNGDIRQAFAGPASWNSVNTEAGNFGKISVFSWEARKRILRGQDITLQSNCQTKPEKFDPQRLAAWRDNSRSSGKRRERLTEGRTRQKTFRSATRSRRRNRQAKSNLSMRPAAKLNL